MFTPQNEDYLLSIRACHYREPSKYKFDQQCKLCLLYTSPSPRDS